MMKGLFLLSLAARVALCQIDIRLQANWENPPFELRLLETVSSENESYYLSSVSKVARFPLTEDDDVFDYTNDEELYHEVFDTLTPIESSLYDIALANKYHSPRIIAHYKHYNDSALPSFSSKLTQKCGEVPRTWLQFNDVVYCNPDDVYALMTDTVKKDDLLPFDRVIGSQGPLLALYGDVKDDKFGDFISNLYDASSAGKLRFVWRYTPCNTGDREILTGYGVDLTLKRTDYIVIDDRDGTIDHKSLGSKTDFSKGSALADVYDDDIRAVKKDDVKELGLRSSSYVLSLGNSTTQLESLIEIVEEFPKYSSYLVDNEINNDLVVQTKANMRRGISTQSQGLFLNGKVLDLSKSNIFDLYKEIKSELEIIKSLTSLGMGPGVSRDLLGKFSVLSMYKERSNVNPRYDITSKFSGSQAINPVVFLNDIENDDVYRSYSDDIEAYIGRFGHGQMPRVRSNIQTLVFAVDLSNQEHIGILNNVMDSVKKAGISQRIGVIPLPLSEQGKVLANNVYHLDETAGTKKVRNFISKLEKPHGNVKELSDTDYCSEIVTPFMSSFDVKGPVFVVNGIFHEIDTNWAYSLTRQISEDVNFIAGMAYQGAATTFEQAEKMLYEDSMSFRNKLLFPSDKALVEYKIVHTDQLQKLLELSDVVCEFTNDKQDGDMATLTFAGNFGSMNTLKQLIEVMKMSLSTGSNLKVRLLHTSDGISFMGKIKQALHESINHTIDVVEDIISDNQFAESKRSVLPGVADALTQLGISSDAFFLLNGRYVELSGSIINSAMLEVFVHREVDQRMSFLKNLVKSIGQADNSHDWFESLSSILSKTYYGGESGSSPRFDFGMLNTELSILIGDKSESMVHLFVVVDPAEEQSQKLLSIASAFKALNFLSLEVLLVPELEMEEIKTKRFYKGNFKSSVEFKDGNVYETPFVGFTNTPINTLFTLDLDVPPSWIVIPKESVSDLDNVLLSKSGPVTGIYQLESLIIEGSAVDVATGSPPTGLSLQVPGSDTNVMTNLGYLQLRANPGLWGLSIKEGRSRDIYNLLSVDSVDSKDTEVKDSATLALLNLDGLYIYPRVQKKPGKESETLIIADDAEDVEEKDQGALSSWFKKGDTKKKQADINIFSVASGHLYERLLSIMTVSVMRNTEHTVKFWLIDNYMSPSFRRFLPHLSKKYGFEYELISYKWPLWLRDQREKQRTIWGYKILFLDVLFPQDLEKVIFVDADQIVRTDMMELVNVDLQGAPYGYTPMGDSRKEMEGFRFWKQGYWKKFLGDDYKYHISALYVIDLKKFRKIAAGDRLRQHYQALSRDPGSLSNLDQDLPNNLQDQLRIFSLPQDWLWCETWCDDASLKTAKTIDLCNNPLTKEPKLDRARRQIPEWSVYDDEITSLRDSVLEHEVGEAVVNEVYQDKPVEELEDVLDADVAPEHDEL